MTSVNKKKKADKEKELIDENLHFHLDQDLIENENDVKRLREILESTEISEEMRAAFKASHQFNEKMKRNNFRISLEELEREL